MDILKVSQKFLRIKELKDNFKKLPSQEIILKRNGVVVEHIKENDIIYSEPYMETGYDLMGSSRTFIQRGVVAYPEPYSKEYIMNFETENNIVLPPELKIYLLEISNSLFTLNFFRKIKLTSSKDLSLPFPLKQKCNPYFTKKDLEFDKEYLLKRNDISVNQNDQEIREYLNINYRYAPSQINYLKQKNIMIQDFEPENDILQGTLKVRTTGCCYYDFIVLNGEYVGTIWHEELAGDGPIYKINDSFFDYLLETK
jgi:hypothetical protein